MDEKQYFRSDKGYISPDFLLIVWGLIDYQILVCYTEIVDYYYLGKD